MADLKEQLSDLTENTFKGYVNPGLYVCDIPTGAGKSYTIGKLICEYYPQHFDRIVILCIQKKLIKGPTSMTEEIERFINSDKSQLKKDDILVLEKNSAAAITAIKNNHFENLFIEMEENTKKMGKRGVFEETLDEITKTYVDLKSFADFFKDTKNISYPKWVEESEGKLRKAICHFFDEYKKRMGKNTSEDQKNRDIIEKFPSLRQVYPQVDIAKKRVLLMTVSKAICGIDTILAKNLTLTDLSYGAGKSALGTGKKKRTLFIFDESDKAAVAMRDVVVDNSIKENDDDSKGYNAFLNFRKLIGDTKRVNTERFDPLLTNNINAANKRTDRIWNETFKGVETYNDIYLSDNEQLESFRHGVFFSGPIVRLDIALIGGMKYSYICYKKGEKNFRLVHSNDEDVLKNQYKIVVPTQQFLAMANRGTAVIKSLLRGVIMESLSNRRKEFFDVIRAQRGGSIAKNVYMRYPSLETEIKTLISRFKTPGKTMFVKQLYDFITNRKNLVFVDKNGSKERMPDFTVYSQGIQFYTEGLEEGDEQHAVRLHTREITTTPEKILVDLVIAGNTVVLSSATASSKTVVSNFDLEYLGQVLGEKISYLSSEDKKKFEDLMDRVSPKEHTVKVVPVESYKFADPRVDCWRMPSEYKELFSKKAQDDGSADRWFSITMGEFIKKQSTNDTNDMDIDFELSRLFQFIKVYNYFSTHKDIHSMIYFQNRSSDKDKLQYNVLSCLIDGTHERALDAFDIKLPADWKSEKIKISKNLEEVDSDIRSKLSQNKDEKIMLITAYGSFGTGANLQYYIPDGIEVVSGDNWESADGRMQKDWDAMYLQSPTSYFMMTEKSGDKYEKGLYNAMLILMMLYERGCLSINDVRTRLKEAIVGELRFSVKENRNVGAARDKAAWAQSIIEQAVGRLCRTRNKPATTHILYDKSMENLLDVSNFNKPMTKEFRVLITAITENKSKQESSMAEDAKNCNYAQAAKEMAEYMRSYALLYTKPGRYNNYDYIEKDDNRVRQFQKMNQAYKRTIIKKPVISSLEELDDTDKHATFITKCYGNWHHAGNNGYIYYYRAKEIVPNPEGATKCCITASSVRLDVLMKNKIIQDYFVAHGYATDWNKEGLILHPQILAYEYAGEIGEEAFKALIMYYCNVSENDLKHLEGYDYELADFVLLNADGSNRIAFDVKNMCAQGHEDIENDQTTSEKRKYKQERLNCPLYTVNMLKLEHSTIDATKEIDGLLTEDGEIIPQAITHLKELINK